MRLAFTMFRLASVLALGSSVVALGCSAAVDSPNTREDSTTTRGEVSPRVRGEEASTSARRSSPLSMPSLEGAFERAAGSAGPAVIAFRYESESGSTGRYFADTGIVCITFPCPSTDEGTFQVTRDQGTTLVRLDGKLGDGRESHSVYEVFESCTGELLLRSTTERDASLVKQKPCVVTGCSGTRCEERHVTTTCDFRPEFACYGQFGFCARNGSGACGWLPTEALQSCIQNPRVFP